MSQRSLTYAEIILIIGALIAAFSIFSIGAAISRRPRWITSRYARMTSAEERSNVTIPRSSICRTRGPDNTHLKQSGDQRAAELEAHLVGTISKQQRPVG